MSHLLWVLRVESRCLCLSSGLRISPSALPTSRGIYPHPFICTELLSKFHWIHATSESWKYTAPCSGSSHKYIFNYLNNLYYTAVLKYSYCPKQQAIQYRTSHRILTFWAPSHYFTELSDKNVRITFFYILLFTSAVWTKSNCSRLLCKEQEGGERRRVGTGKGK